MTSLSDRLAVPPVTEPSFARDSEAWEVHSVANPRDWNSKVVTFTGVPEELKTEEDWTKAVKEMGGIAIPAGYRVRLVEMKHQTHGWTRANKEDAATTGPTWWYRFAVEPAGNDLANADDIIKAIGRRRAPFTGRSSGPEVFHFLAGDLQLGKVDGDGSEGIVASLTQSLEIAAAELKQQRKLRPIGTAHMAWLGDCIEGNQSQGGKNFWRTELTLTEQTRIFRRMMMYGVELFAPLVEDLQIDVVNGNHDRVQDFQNTRGDDGHATEAGISLADALTLNTNAYGHVQVFVPNKDSSYLTRQIGSSIFTMAHGHQWRRGKAWDWWAGQALNLQNPGAAHFLLHGHYHTMSVDTKRERTVICTPTFEDRSQWWHERTGDLARRGAITMTSFEGEFKNLHIL